MNLSIAPSCPSDAATALQKLWGKSNKNLEQLIVGWISEERSIEIISGWEDDNPAHPRAYILFLDGTLDVAEFYMSVSQVKELFPAIESCIPPEMANEITTENTEQIEDTAFFERRDAALGGQWSENVCEVIFPIESAIMIALGYALGKQAKVVISRVSEYILEELTDGASSAERLLSVTATQSNPKTRFAKTEFFYACKTS